MKKVFLLSLVVLALSIVTRALFDDGYRKPIFNYQGQFDVRNISAVEKYMGDIAIHWGFELFEKDRDEMKLLSLNEPAFFIAFYSEGESVLVITNAGYAPLLTLSLMESQEMPVERLEALANEVRNGLQERFNIQLNAVES